MQCESDPSDTSERSNPYWCPQFGSTLLKIAKHFPLWTAVMSTRVASSACSKEYFRELKQLIFKGAKCTRVDKFIVTHIRLLADAVKILQANNMLVASNNSDNLENNNDRSINNNNSTIDSTKDSSINNNDSTIDNSKDFEIIDNENKINIPVPIDSDSNNEDNRANLSFQYLNNIENWKGKNNSPKKCGKYLTVCPDVENFH